MLAVSPYAKILLAIEPVDFRKGMDALVRLCQHQFRQAPFEGHFFIFRNRRKTDIKVLHYDRQGFCLFHKRLSTGRFNHWPTAQMPLISLSETELHVLLANGNPLAIEEQAPWR